MISTHERHNTLKHMGIPQWYSRKVLVGACASPEFDFPGLVAVPDVEELTVAPAEPVLTQTSAPKEAGTGAGQLLRDLDLPVSQGEQSVVKVAQSVDTVVNTTSNQLSTPTTADAFTFRSYVSNDVLVISDSAMNFPALKEQALMHNILKACGRRTDELSIGRSLNWPVFGSKKLYALNESHLGGLIERWLREQSGNNISLCFLMGTKVDACDELIRTVAGESCFVQKCSASLMEMLTMPAKKSLVWRELQPNLSRFSG